MRLNKQIHMLLGLVLMTMLLTGCARGLQVQERVKVQPTSNFLLKLVDEYSNGVYGDATREVVKDWVAQNEPDDLKK